MRDDRRRSPESSRRRRASRRLSREQLAAAAAAAATHPQHTASASHMDSQAVVVAQRSRADSSTSGSGSATSSTSSSLLNISRPSRFGIRNFFTRSASKKRVRRRRSFRQKNASSSSVDSDLAYGKGYISRSASDRRDPGQLQLQQQQQHGHHYPQHPQHAPQHPYPLPHPQHPPQQHGYPPRQNALMGPDGRPQLTHAQTDEEIIRIGRQLSELARAQNRQDLEASGRHHRPSSQLVAAGAGLGALYLGHSAQQSNARGIGSSRPSRRNDNSDDEDWESASDDDDDSSGSDFDAGLAYGSVPHFSNPHLPPSIAPLPGQPSIVSERPAEAIRPPDRKSSAVDPALFGPENSLRGYINTPCGYRPGEYPYQQHQPPPSSAPPHHQHQHDPIPPTGSASIEATRPLRQVYPVATGDPNNYEAASSSVTSIPQAHRTDSYPSRASYAASAPPQEPTNDFRPTAYALSGPPPQQPTYVSRPAPVPIQAPKPRIPVSPQTLEDKRSVVEQQRRVVSDDFPSPALVLGGAAVVAGAAAAIANSGRDKRCPDDKPSSSSPYDRHHPDRRDDRRSDDRPRDDYDHPKRDDTRRNVPAVAAALPHNEPRRDEWRPQPAAAVPASSDARMTTADQRPQRWDDRREEPSRDKRTDERDRRGKEPSVVSAVAPALVGAMAGAAIASDRKDKKRDEKRAAEDRVREDRERDEQKRRLRLEEEARLEAEARRLREDRDREEKRRLRLEEEARLEAEARRLREDTEYREWAERRTREHREVKYKEERRSHDARERAERERAALLLQEKRDRDEKRRLDAEGDRARELSSDRRKRRDEVTVVQEAEPRQGSGSGTVVAVAAAAAAAGVVAAVAASEVSSASRSEKKREAKSVASTRSDKTRASDKSDSVPSLTPKTAEQVPGKPSKEERKRQREETRRMLAEIQAELERERERARLGDEVRRSAPEPAPEPVVAESSTARTVVPEGTVDPFQFQVPDDAFRTPIYSISPSRRVVEPPAVEVAPHEIVTVEPPSFDREDRAETEDEITERSSRRDAFEKAEKYRQYREAKSQSAKNSPDAPVELRDAASPPPPPELDDKRKREAEPVRDPVQEEADRAYREHRMQAKMAAEEIRSRSASPEPSVVGKWNEEVEDPVVRIVTPPEMKRGAAPKKSKFDGPDADVRIDNVIMPHDMHRFKPVPTYVGGMELMPIFKSMDPDAERERPVLNLVLPTPKATPSPEKQRERRRAPPQESEGPPAEIVTVEPPGFEEEDAASTTARSVTEAGSDKGKEKEVEKVSGAEDESSAVQKAALEKLRGGRKELTWGTIFATASGAVAGAVGASSAKAEEQKPEPEPTQATTEPEPVAEAPRAVHVDLDDAPPPPVGPKPTFARSVTPEPEPTPTPDFVEAREHPASPETVVDARELDDIVDHRSASPSQMPGSFGEDLDFAATLAAGLESSGFDPNIVIEDPTYHRRDTPPGSNGDDAADSFYQPPAASTAAETISSLSLGSRGLDDDAAGVGHEWDTPTKPSKKKGRKGKRAASVASVPAVEAEAPVEPETPVEDEWAGAAAWGATPSEASKKEDDTPREIVQEPEAVAPEPEAPAAPEPAEDIGDKFRNGDSSTTTGSPAPAPAPESEVSVTSSKKSKKARRKTKDATDFSTPEQTEPPDPGPPGDDNAGESFQVISERDVASVVSEPVMVSQPNGNDNDNDNDDTKSVVSTPATTTATKKKKKKGKGNKSEVVESTPIDSTPATTETEKDSATEPEQPSFLGNAGTIGAGVGMTGAAAVAAFATELLSRIKATTPQPSDDDVYNRKPASDEEEWKKGKDKMMSDDIAFLASLQEQSQDEDDDDDPHLQPQTSHHHRSVSYSSDRLDPEIVAQRREIKVTIDPLFGDLIRLPPSEPGSPTLPPLEPSTLPALPLSRPDTPPEQRTIPSRPGQHRRGLSETPSRPKTPSQTAVPVLFRVGGAGRRSMPSSPAVGNASRTASPVIGASDVPAPGTPRSHKRPMSWGYGREIKPIYLMEKTAAQAHKADEQETDYPELPPSEPESPAPEAVFTRDEDVEYTDYLRLRRGLEGLAIETGSDAREGDEDVLGSEEVTPTAEMFSRGVFGGPLVPDDAALPELSLGVSVEDPELSLEAPVEEGAVEREVPRAAAARSRSSRSSSVFRGEATILEEEEAEAEDDLSMLPPLPASRDPSPTREEDLSMLPALPESRSASPTVARPSTPEVAVEEADLSTLPPLPESRSVSPTLVRASTPETAPEEDLSTLPALPRSRSVSPTLVRVSTPKPVEEDLSQLPPLPRSRSVSPILMRSYPLEKAVEEDLSMLPALPASRSSSPSWELKAETDLSTLPPLPESHSVSPTLVRPSTPQPATEDDLSQLPPLPQSLENSPTLARSITPKLDDLSQLPALPESRESSPTRAATPSPTVFPPSLMEEPTLVASSSDMPTFYEDLKSSLRADKDDSSHSRSADFGLAAAAATSGLVVAHMLTDDTASNLPHDTFDKPRLLTPQPSHHKTESVISDTDNASTVAASEAPTSFSLLSGSTWVGRRDSIDNSTSATTKESPRLERFAYVPPYLQPAPVRMPGSVGLGLGLGMSGSAPRVFADNMVQGSEGVGELDEAEPEPAAPAKKSKKKKKGKGAVAALVQKLEDQTQTEPEPEAEEVVEAKAEAGDVAAQEDKVKRGDDDQQQRSTTTLKKGKKKGKGGKKESSGEAVVDTEVRA